MADVANPGSDQALLDGCRCPVLDNAHGAGYLGGMRDKDGQPMFVIVDCCPLHGSETDYVQRRLSQT